MFKVTLFIVLIFLVFFLWRVLRLFVAALLRPSRRSNAGPARVEGEMVRDPVCGVWIDRRLALPVGSGPGSPAVCSETCRLAAQRGERRFAP